MIRFSTVKQPLNPIWYSLKNSDNSSYRCCKPVGGWVFVGESALCDDTDAVFPLYCDKVSSDMDGPC